jgi:hypothetical protein
MAELTLQTALPPPLPSSSVAWSSATRVVVAGLESRRAWRPKSRTHSPGAPPRASSSPAWSPAARGGVPNALASSSATHPPVLLSWVDGWRPVLCLAAERVLFCTFSHLGFILHARYARSIGDDASRYSAPDPGILPLHGRLQRRLESA